MTLEEYVEETKKHLDMFKKQWLANHTWEPEKWPMSYEPGDWDEQFMMFDPYRDDERDL